MSKRRITTSAVLAAVLMLGLGACAAKAPAPVTSAAAAPAGDCKIDAVKMCQAASGNPQPSTVPKATGMGYGASSGTMPDTIQFDIPNGPSLQLMCYYDPQHTAITRAEIANEVAMSAATVKYLRTQKFCAGQ